MDSIFTKIIRGEIPGTFVWADDVCVAFATIEPLTPGHILLVPRAEVPSYWEADPEDVAHMAKVAQILSRAQLRAFDAVRIGQIVAGFDVNHLHIHLVPLSDQGQLNLALARPAAPEDLAQACAKIRDALIEAGYGDHVTAQAPGA